MWATTLLNHPEPALQWGVVLATSSLAAGWDLGCRRIPNLLTGAVWIAGLGTSLALAGLPGLADAVLGCCLLAAPYVLLWAFAGGGAGDAKMMGAVGAWMGIVLGVLCLVAVSLAGVLLAMACAARAGRLRAVLSSVSSAAKGVLVPVFGAGSAADVRAVMPPVRGAQTFPYGVAILVGNVAAAGVVFLWS